MLRWVALITRRLLLVAGLLLVAWMPLSYMWFVVIWIPGVGVSFVTRNGWGQGSWVYRWTGAPPVQPSFQSQSAFPPRADDWRSLWQPDVAWSDTADAFILLRMPLWLLAFVCLAWPVTSFVVGRRRRGARGFDVEAKAAGDPV